MKSSATGSLPVHAFSFLVGSLCFRTLLMTYTNIYNTRTRSLMRHQNWDDKHVLLVLWLRSQMQYCKSICSLFNDIIYRRVKRRLETRRSGQLINPSVLLEVHEFSSLCVCCYKIQWRKHTPNMLIQISSLFTLQMVKQTCFLGYLRKSLIECYVSSLQWHKNYRWLLLFSKFAFLGFA
jgi:hypothetical protein